MLAKENLLQNYWPGQLFQMTTKLGTRCPRIKGIQRKFVGTADSKHFMFTCLVSAAVEQWVRAFASHAEDWVFESQPQQTQLSL